MSRSHSVNHVPELHSGSTHFGDRLHVIIFEEFVIDEPHPATIEFTGSFHTLYVSRIRMIDWNFRGTLV